MTDKIKQQEEILRRWMNGEQYFVPEIGAAVRIVAGENVAIVKEALTYLRTCEKDWCQWVNLSYLVVSALLKVEQNSTFPELYHIHQMVHSFFEVYENAYPSDKVQYLVVCYENADKLRTLLSYLDNAEKNK